MTMGEQYPEHMSRPLKSTICQLVRASGATPGVFYLKRENRFIASFHRNAVALIKIDRGDPRYSVLLVGPNAYTLDLDVGKATSLIYG